MRSSTTFFLAQPQFQAILDKAPTITIGQIKDFFGPILDNLYKLSFFIVLTLGAIYANGLTVTTDPKLLEILDEIKQEIIKSNSNFNDYFLADESPYNNFMTNVEEGFEAVIEAINQIGIGDDTDLTSINAKLTTIIEQLTAIQEEAVSIEAAVVSVDASIATVDASIGLLDADVAAGSTAIIAAIGVQTTALMAIEPVPGTASLGDINYHVDGLEGTTDDILTATVQLNDKVQSVHDLVSEANKLLNQISGNTGNLQNIDELLVESNDYSIIIANNTSELVSWTSEEQSLLTSIDTTLKDTSHYVSAIDASAKIVAHEIPRINELADNTDEANFILTEIKDIINTTNEF